MTEPMQDTTNTEAKASEPPWPPKIAYHQISPDAVRPLWALEEYVRNSGLEPGLIELVKLRVAQINGCAYCIDMHTKDARAGGETEQQLYALAVWQETPFYSQRERAALAVTQVSRSHVPDPLYELARKHFDQKQLVDLTMAVVAINSWNRLAISFRAVPGTYQPGKR